MTHPNPYAHLNSRLIALADRLEQQASAEGADLADLLKAADLPDTDKAVLAQAWGGLEAAAEYKSDDTDEF